MDINARLAAIAEKRSADGLTIWFIGELGGAVAIGCANEASKAAWLASLAAKGRVMLSDNGKAGLAATYVDWIGYDPFEDCPSMTEKDVANILAEYPAIVAAAQSED